MNKCGCGRDGKYMHFIGDDEVYSCNKHNRCLTYDEQQEKLDSTWRELQKYRLALKKITRVNAMDYEYKAWAKEALKHD